MIKISSASASLSCIILKAVRLDPSTWPIIQPYRKSNSLSNFQSLLNFGYSFCSAGTPAIMRSIVSSKYFMYSLLSGIALGSLKLVLNEFFELNSDLGLFFEDLQVSQLCDQDELFVMRLWCYNPMKHQLLSFLLFLRPQYLLPRRQHKWDHCVVWFLLSSISSIICSCRKRLFLNTQSQTTLDCYFSKTPSHSRVN